MLNFLNCLSIGGFLKILDFKNSIKINFSLNNIPHLKYNISVKF